MTFDRREPLPDDLLVKQFIADNSAPVRGTDRTIAGIRKAREIAENAIQAVLVKLREDTGITAVGIVVGTVTMNLIQE